MTTHIHYNHRTPMFNHLIKNFNMEALPIPKQFKQAPIPNNNAESGQDFERIVEVVLKLLSSALGEKLGEAVQQGEWRELSGQLLRSRGMESQLVEVKQRYNDLAMRSSSLLQQAKRISSSVGEFITSINLFLDSQELLVPLKEIQKGISELSADRVEKQMRYLISIFQHNFTQAIERRVTAAQSALNEELKLLKNLNKNLEGELIALKNSKNQEGSKVYELSLKVNTLNQKITKLSTQKADLQRGIRAQQSAGQEQLQERTQLERQVSRLRAREADLHEKLKAAQAKTSRTQRSLKEQSNQTEALNAVIQRLKLKQEEIAEQLQQEARKREAASETLRKKLQNEKVALEEQLESHRERYSQLEAAFALKEQEAGRLKQELKGIREKGGFQVDLTKPSKQEIPQPQQPIEGEQPPQHHAEPSQKISLNELLSRLNTLQTQKKDLQAHLDEATSVGVNKEVLKSLFLSYDDESKEWTVRRNIKQQIYSLLDLKDRLTPPEDPKPAKWFGLF